MIIEPGLVISIEPQTSTRIREYFSVTFHGREGGGGRFC